MSKTGKRGRPEVYTGELAERIGKVITGTISGEGGANLSHAKAILNARNGVVGLTKVEQELARQRAELGFTKPLGISQPTLAKIASNLGITVRGRGRPAKVAVADAA
jgi:hypothetical protein